MTTSQGSKASLSAAALFSFLKETRGLTTWMVRDLATTLTLSNAAAKQALTILEMQGYAKPAGSKNEWITTPEGEAVSGSKFPRYTRAAVERSLSAFADHLKRVNDDSHSPYKIVEAIAFGDFLTSRARVQAADIGIRLQPRNDAARERRSAQQETSEAGFLRQLRGGTPLLNLLPYAGWMATRSHRKLLRSPH